MVASGGNWIRSATRGREAVLRVPWLYWCCWVQDRRCTILRTTVHWPNLRQSYLPTHTARTQVLTQVPRYLWGLRPTTWCLPRTRPRPRNVPYWRRCGAIRKWLPHSDLLTQAPKHTNLTWPGIYCSTGRRAPGQASSLCRNCRLYHQSTKHMLPQLSNVKLDSPKDNERLILAAIPTLS